MTTHREWQKVLIRQNKAIERAIAKRDEMIRAAFRDRENSHMSVLQIADSVKLTRGRIYQIVGEADPDPNRELAVGEDGYES